MQNNFLVGASCCSCWFLLSRPPSVLVCPPPLLHGESRSDLGPPPSPGRGHSDVNNESLEPAGAGTALGRSARWCVQLKILIAWWLFSSYCSSMLNTTVQTKSYRIFPSLNIILLSAQKTSCLFDIFHHFCGCHEPDLHPGRDGPLTWINFWDVSFVFESTDNFKRKKHHDICYNVCLFYLCACLFFSLFLLSESNVSKKTSSQFYRAVIVRLLCPWLPNLSSSLAFLSLFAFMASQGRGMSTFSSAWKPLGWHAEGCGFKTSSWKPYRLCLCIPFWRDQQRCLLTKIFVSVDGVKEQTYTKGC